MTSPASPAETRAYIVERLVGATGEPDHVTGAARSLIERALPSIMAGLAEHLSLALTVELKSVDLIRTSAARPAGEGSAMAIAASTSSSDALNLSMNGEAASIIIGTLFGGDPEMPAPPLERPLSPTEVDVATTVFEEIARAVNGSGARSLELKLPLATAVTGAELQKKFLRDGPGVRVELAISTPASSGRIWLVMPQRVLLKHRGASAKDGAAAAAWRQRFSDEVMRSNVDLQATMPLGRMTLGQIAAMHEGQIIEFDADAQSQARLSARQRTLFVCEFGKLGQNYTVRIRHPFDAGQELMDGLLPG